MSFRHDPRGLEVACFLSVRRTRRRIFTFLSEVADDSIELTYCVVQGVFLSSLIPRSSNDNSTDHNSTMLAGRLEG